MRAELSRRNGRLSARDDDALRRTAQRLQDLAQVLQPGRERREPPPAPARAAARKAARHAVARKSRARKA